jgi:hypothetical protein
VLFTANSSRLLLASVLLAVMVSLDFVAPTGDWYSRHPMTSAALGTVLSFWIAGMLLEGWFRDREARKLERISTVAYRSLAQYANDAGRTILGALNGADLHLLGLPDATPASVRRSRDLLSRNGVPVAALQVSGSWRPDDREALKGALHILLRDGEFGCELFRTVARARRRVQEGTALWAPVMLTAPTLARDLGRFREVADSLELLQEHLRPVASYGDAPASFEAEDAWVASVSDAFWAVVHNYESVRDEFGDRALLPSDVALSGRRVRQPAGGVVRVSTPVRDRGSVAPPA